MNLSVLDRVVILTILPKEGNFATLRILQDLRMALSFTEKEVKEFGVTVDLEAGKTNWNEDTPDVEIPMGEKATEIVVDAFKRLDQSNKLNADMLETYEKFITPG
jgi:hypothetical protein